MKKTILSIIMLFFASFTFAQHMEWNHTYSPFPYKGSYTYADSTKIVYDSGDGILSFTYELSGDVLSYDIYVNIPSGSEQYYFGSGAWEEGNSGPFFWNLNYPNYTWGYQYFSGSVILEFDEPTQIALMTYIEKYNPVFDSWGSEIYATYHPY